jgi:dihydrolipoamide dehydrogenase
MATPAYDLAVIGAGPGGYVAAIRAAQLGLKVACVEKEKALGGTCLRIGCIPSKAMLESSHRYVEARGELSGHGIKAGNIELDLAAMLKRKDQVVGQLTRGVESLLKKNKIARYSGHGRLEGNGRVKIEGGEENNVFKCKNVLLATGSRSATLSGVELDGDRIGTSTEALAYPEVPGHLVVIGAGYIGLDLGSVVPESRLGNQFESFLVFADLDLRRGTVASTSFTDFGEGVADDGSEGLCVAGGVVLHLHSMFGDGG